MTTTHRGAANLSLVYIILLNWHGWRDAIICLDSLAFLDYTNYRVLVVDNGSSDDSVARIRAAHPQVLILETGRNLGFSGGCNVGIRRALEEGADYIWLLNNDTTVDPQALAAMVAVAEADPCVGAVGSVLYYMDNPKDIQAWGGGRVCFWSGRTRHNLYPVPTTQVHYLTAASILIRRTPLVDVGLLDENTFFMYWEDTDFSFRLRKEGWRLAVAERSIVLHKEHSATGKGSPLLDYYFNESAIRFFLRHASTPAVPIVIGVGGRLMKRILRGNMKGALSVVAGAIKGFHGANNGARKV